MLLGAPLGAGTPHWCVRSIIGHDSPIFQHGGLFSGAAGATRLMRIVHRQALPAKPARTRCIAAGSQHYERSMSTPPDWPGPNTSPPLHSQAKAWTHGASQRVLLTRKRSDQRAAWHAGRLFRSNWRAVCLRDLSARSPRSKARQAARPPTFRALSTARAHVLSQFPLFWHKFTVVNDDGCLRKSLPYLRNSVNWGYAFFQTRWSS